jgi:hypothetical protein
VTLTLVWAWIMMRRTGLWSACGGCRPERQPPGLQALPAARRRSTTLRLLNKQEVA